MEFEKKWHTIIHNPDDIKRFGRIFGIDKRNLAMCLYLTLRRKYYPSASQGTIILNRVVVGGGHDFEDKLYRHILRLETPIGSYFDSGHEIPDGVLALYVIVDPKDTVKALSRSLSRCVEAFTNEEEEIPNGLNLFREELAKSNLTGYKYRQIDLDTKETERVELVNKLLKELKVEVLICIETRGGFHIVYRDIGDKIMNKTLHEFKQRSKDWFSIINQPMVIMPGTYQGDFPARIISLDGWLNE